MTPRLGALSGTSLTALPADDPPEIVRKIDVDEDGVYRSPRVTLPYRPHLGTLICSPEIDPINTLRPDAHGDATSFVTGTSLVVDGALAHGVQFRSTAPLLNRTCRARSSPGRSRWSGSATSRCTRCPRARGCSVSGPAAPAWA